MLKELFYDINKSSVDQDEKSWIIPELEYHQFPRQNYLLQVCCWKMIQMCPMKSSYSWMMLMVVIQSSSDHPAAVVVVVAAVVVEASVVVDVVLLVVLRADHSVLQLSFCSASNSWQTWLCLQSSTSLFNKIFLLNLTLSHFFHQC